MIRYSLFLFLIGIFSSLIALADVTPAATEGPFNPETANQNLDQLQSQFSTSALGIQELEAAISALKKQQIEAKMCVTNSEAELEQIEQQLKTINPKDLANKQLSTEENYLDNKKTRLTVQLSECRLFLLRSSDSISNLGLAVQRLTRLKLLATEPNVFKKFVLSLELIKQLPDQIDNNLLFERSGLKAFDQMTLIVFIIFIFVSVIVGIALRNLLSKRMRLLNGENLQMRLMQTVSYVLRKYVVAFFILLFFAAFSAAISIGTPLLPYVNLIGDALFIYVLALFFISLFFNPPKPAQPLSHFPEAVGKIFAFRLKILATVCLVGFVLYVLFHEQKFPAATFNFARTIFISLIAINLMSVIWLINRMPKFLSLPSALRSFFSLVLGIALLIILVAEWLGYHGIANYLLIGIAWTAVAGFVAWALYKISFSAIQSLSGNEYSWQKHLHAYLGIKKFVTVQELIWLRMTAYILIWGGFLLLLMRIWGLSKLHFNEIMVALLYGVKIGNLDIVPSRILFAILLFIVLSAGTRLLRTRVSNYQVLEETPGARDALASIVGYVGFALAVLFALLMAGVNFSGLAIIAGALSVGIGFGLQNIVNNFVSGIILLIERPIKLGDRIIVGNTEGYVKKISIRFTQIETPQRADVIVPNAELISGQVTNLMYRNTYSRIALQVSVINGSDSELVKKLLLEIAHQHSGVISDYPANAPLVEFKGFDTSSNMIFEISCLIRNVVDQGIIKSDFNFAIDQKFKENQIQLARPQQEIYLHDKNQEKKT